MTRGEKAAIRMILGGGLSSSRGNMVRQAIIDRSGWIRWADLLEIAERYQRKQEGRPHTDLITLWSLGHLDSDQPRPTALAEGE